MLGGKFLRNSKCFPGNWERPLIFHLRGNVILTIWWQVLLVTLYTAGIIFLHNYVQGMKLNFPLSLVSVLGVVTGLLLVFRTNTAYDRYWEGRKLWSTMTLNVRNLTRLVWVMVDEKEGTSSELIEKSSVINLLVAFVYATRNYLREEYSYEEEDIRELINHLPRFQEIPSSNNVQQNLETNGKSKTKAKISARASKKLSRPISSDIENRKMSMGVAMNTKAFDTTVPTNIPIEIVYFIASYIKSVEKRELGSFLVVGHMMNACNSLMECLTGFERILRTPIPLAYSVHLQQATWVYILALPFQLAATLNWATVPAVALAAFALLGILGIGWEIENPFGYDENDLPLDDICKAIHMEILTIVGNKMPSLESWVLSGENHPLLPACSLTASELAEMPVEEIRNILANSSKSAKTWMRNFTTAAGGNLEQEKNVIVMEGNLNPGFN